MLATATAATSTSFTRGTRTRALVVGDLPWPGFAAAREMWTVMTAPAAVSPASLATRVGDVEVLAVGPDLPVTRELLEAAPSLTAVGVFGLPTHQVDLAAATERGVAVFNAPFSNARSVAEFTVAQVIMLLRRLPDKNAALHAGVWDKSAQGAHEVRGRTLGIVGYGRIGTQVSVVAEALGMKVLYYDRVERLAVGNARPCASLEDLLAAADVVTLHVDGAAGAAGRIGQDELARMRPGAVLLNLCRGFTLDHEALREHLLDGHLAGAAVDVHPDEPVTSPSGFRSVLRGAPNTILTPHVAGETQEAHEDLAAFVTGKLHSYLRSGDTSTSVNLPQLQPAAQAGTLRIAHLHSNLPGVLAAVNDALAAGGANVVAQHLATRDQVGYAVTDVESEAGQGRRLLAAVRSLPATIRARALPGTGSGGPEWGC